MQEPYLECSNVYRCLLGGDRGDGRWNWYDCDPVTYEIYWERATSAHALATATLDGNKLGFCCDVNGSAWGGKAFIRKVDLDTYLAANRWDHDLIACVEPEEPAFEYKKAA